MTTNRFRNQIADGTRVILSVPEKHRAHELNGKSAMVLRCLGCADEDNAPETIDYLVIVDGFDSIIDVPSHWITEQ